MMSVVPIKPMVRAVRKVKAVEVKHISLEELAVREVQAREVGRKVTAAHAGLYVNKLWVVRYDADFAKSQAA